MNWQDAFCMYCKRAIFVLVRAGIGFLMMMGMPT